MDSDEGYNYEFDEDEECSEEDSGAEEEEDDDEDEPDDDNLDLGEVELVEPGLGVGGERDGLLCGETGGGGGSALGPGGGGGGGGGGGPGHEQEEDYRYEVLTAEQILQHMVECIREVNEVIQVRGPATPSGPGAGRRIGPWRPARRPRGRPGPGPFRACPLCRPVGRCVWAVLPGVLAWRRTGAAGAALSGSSCRTTAPVSFLVPEDGPLGQAGGGGEGVSVEEVSERIRPFSPGLS